MLPKALETLIINLMVVAALGGQAFAQTVPAGAKPEPSTAAPPPSGVSVYPSAYFATWRPSTALDMVSRLPGFEFDGGAQVRGFETGAGNVVIDGQRPTAKQDDLNSVLRRIPASHVERIEVVREAGHGVDMLGHTVVANVIRKKTAEDSLVVTALVDQTPRTGRTLPSARLEARHPIADGVLEGSISAQYYSPADQVSGSNIETDSSALPSSINCAPVCVDHLSTRIQGVIGKSTLAYQAPLLGGVFRINGDATLDQYSDREGDQGLPAIHDDKLNFSYRGESGEIGVNYKRNLDPKTTLEVLSIWQTSQSYQDDNYISNLRQNLATGNRLSEGILRGVFRRQFSDRLSIGLTAEAADNVQNTANLYLVNGQQTPFPAARVRVEEQRAQSDVMASWAMRSNLTLESGVQVEASTIKSRGDVMASKSLNYVKPRLILTWKLDPKTEFKARAAREVGQLDFSAFVESGLLNTGAHAGNPALLPQDAKIYEIALDRKFWGQGGLNVTLQHADLANAIDRVRGYDPTDPTNPNGFYDTPGNIGRGRSNQLNVELAAPLDRWKVRNGFLTLQALWRDVKVRDPTTDLSRSQSLVHPFDGMASFDQTLAGGKINWGLEFHPPQNEVIYRYNEIDRAHYGATLSIFYEYRPTKSVSWRVTVSDVTSRTVDRSYLVFLASRPAPYAFFDARVQSAGPDIQIRMRRVFP